MQKLSVCASVCLCLYSLTIYKVSNLFINSNPNYNSSTPCLPQVCSQPVTPFISCGCLEQSQSVSLTDTREMSLSASERYGVCMQMGDMDMFTFGGGEGKEDMIV